LGTIFTVGSMPGPSTATITNSLVLLLSISLSCSLLLNIFIHDENCLQKFSLKKLEMRQP
jgi:hypothetical protein